MTNDTTTTVQAYADIDGLATYYEATGDGPPLVLLHGGMCPIETWGDLVPHLAGSFRVFTPERRGHGRTADPGTITYEAMAADTVTFLEDTVSEAAGLVGWSDGATVALLVALWRPDLVERLVYVGQPVNHSGLAPEVAATLDRISPEALPPPLRPLYQAVSPDGPEHFDVVFAKVSELWGTDTAMALDELEALTPPTLLAAADHDLVTVEHLFAMQRVIPNAQLAVVPGADHGFPMQHPDLLAALVLRFLS